MNPIRRLVDLLYISSAMSKYKFAYADVKEAMRIFDNMRKAKYYRKILNELKGIAEEMEP